MPPKGAVDVVLTPAEIRCLPKANLSRSVCVVLDVLRATSSMVTALANGAAAIVPADSPGHARALAGRLPGALLAGERDRVRIPGFDLANSPRDFLPAAVSGRTIVMATTNGTRAIHACRHARAVYVACFLNMAATARAVSAALRGGRLEARIVCAGTVADFSWEDFLAAGLLVQELLRRKPALALSDSARAALAAYRTHAKRLRAALEEGTNGRVLARLGLAKDVAWCARRDAYTVVGRRVRGGLGRIVAD